MFSQRSQSVRSTVTSTVPRGLQRQGRPAGRVVAPPPPGRARCFAGRGPTDTSPGPRRGGGLAPIAQRETVGLKVLRCRCDRCRCAVARSPAVPPRRRDSPLRIVGVVRDLPGTRYRLHPRRRRGGGGAGTGGRAALADVPGCGSGHDPGEGRAQFSAQPTIHTFATGLGPVERVAAPGHGRLRARGPTAADEG